MMLGATSVFLIAIDPLQLWRALGQSPQIAVYLSSQKVSSMVGLKSNLRQKIHFFCRRLDSGVGSSGIFERPIPTTAWCSQSGLTRNLTFHKATYIPREEHQPQKLHETSSVTQAIEHLHLGFRTDVSMGRAVIPILLFFFKVPQLCRIRFGNHFTQRRIWLWHCLVVHVFAFPSRPS